MNLVLVRGDSEIAARVTPDGAGYRVVVGETARRVEGTIGRLMRVRIDSRPVEASVRWLGGSIVVRLRGRSYAFRPRDPRAPKLGPRRSVSDAALGELHAPMPGLVVEILAQVGEMVEAGSPLVVVEAMKMQNALVAPLKGRVAAIRVGPGTAVEAGQLLLAVTPDPG